VSFGDAGLPVPEARAAVPRSITFQRKRANRRITNEAAFLQLLRSYAPVQVGHQPGIALNSLDASLIMPVCGRLVLDTAPCTRLGQVASA
jgi:hypothetical protein